MINEEDAEMIRIQVRGLGANLSAFVERHKEIERENHLLRMRISQLEATNVTLTVLPKHVSTQTEISVDETTPSPTSPRSQSPSPPQSPFHTKSSPHSLLQSPQQSPLQQMSTPPVSVASSTISPTAQVELVPSPLIFESVPPDDQEISLQSTIDEGDCVESDSVAKEDSSKTEAPRHSRVHVRLNSLDEFETPSTPFGLAEILHMNPDPTTAAAMATIAFTIMNNNRNFNDGGNNGYVGYPNLLPTLWHVIARRARSRPRRHLCEHILRRTPASPSDGGLGLGFLLGDVVFRDVV